MSKAAAHNTTPHSLGGKGTGTEVGSTRQRSQFLVMAANMTWQLAVVVMLPIVGGVQLDKVFNTSPVLLFVGLAVAVAGSAVVMWRTMQNANQLPVPKLTDGQRKAIQKSYEEDDD